MHACTRWAKSSETYRRDVANQEYPAQLEWLYGQKNDGTGHVRTTFPTKVRKASQGGARRRAARVMAAGRARQAPSLAWSMRCEWGANGVRMGCEWGADGVRMVCE